MTLPSPPLASPPAPGRPAPATARNAWQLSPTHVDLRRPTLASRAVQVDAEPQTLTLDLARTAVVVVDMQNDFCHPDGWLAGIGVDVTPARAPIPVLGGLLPTLRAQDVPVVWVSWGNRPDRANLPPGVLHVYDPAGTGTGIGTPSNRAGSPVLERDAWAAAVVEELAADPAFATDLHVDKYRMSGFVDTPLDSILRNLRVDTLLLAGVNADQCVLATLMDAANIGYDVVLVTDAAATTSPEFCMDATLYNVRQCFGFTTTSSSVLAALPGAAR